MGYRVVITFRAADDLFRIRGYIAETDRATAGRFVQKLSQRILILETFPYSGRMVPELESPSIRELIHGPYRIIYRVREKDRLVEVARYWHGARGAPKL